MLPQIIFLLLSIFPFDIFTQGWLEVSSLPTSGRDDGISFSLNGFGYVVTGKADDEFDSNKLFQYDVNNNLWTEKADFPGLSRQYSCVFTIENKAFLIGGYSATNEALNDVWMYDSEGDYWIQKNPFPGVVRWDATSVSINEFGYYGMGTNFTTVLSDFWEYNYSTDTWSLIGDYPGGKGRGIVAIELLDKAIFGFGINSENNTFLENWYEFNTNDFQWKKIESFPGELRWYSTFISNKTKGIVCGGMDEGGVFQNDCYGIDYSKKWFKINDLPIQGLRGSVGFSISDNFYIGTGLSHTLNRISNFYKYNFDDQYNKTKIFPNPSLNDFYLVTSVEAQVSIFSIQGEMIKDVVFTKENGFYIIKNLASGIYLVQLHSDGYFEQIKIVKQ